MHNLEWQISDQMVSGKDSMWTLICVHVDYSEKHLTVYLNNAQIYAIFQKIRMFPLFFFFLHLKFFNKLYLPKDVHLSSTFLYPVVLP